MRGFLKIKKPHFCLILFIILLAACSGKKSSGYELEPAIKPDVSVIYSENGRELLRYYRFTNPDGNGEWITLSPKGFYDASPGGAFLITVKTGNGSFSLKQFSQLLYRPDLITEVLKKIKPYPELLPSHTPDLAFLAERLKSAFPGITPDLSDVHLSDVLDRVKPAPEISVSVQAGAARITLAENAQNAGKAVLYYRDNKSLDSPIAFYDVGADDTNADTNELEINLPKDEIYVAGSGFAVSVFNREGTMESGRIFIGNETEKPASVPGSQTLPVLHIIPMVTDTVSPMVTDTSLGDLKDAAGRQENTGLYSKTEICDSYGNNLMQTPSEYFTTVSKDMDSNDLFILLLPFPSGADDNGDLVFSFPLPSELTGTSNGNSDKQNLDKWDLTENILKLRAQKGIILINSQDKTAPFLKTGLERLQEWLGPDRILAVLPETAISELLRSSGEPFITTADLQALASVKTSFPVDDFPFMGRLQKQAPASGGNQGYATQSLKEYLNFLASRDLKGSLPDFGVFLDELNPKNYQKVDTPLLQTMGMEQYYIYFLTGNKYYEAGDYVNAITEYSNSIGLKQDFADAYAWRGNAYRKKGNPDEAISDYTSALKYRANYPEVLNYRGYLYAQKGDYDRAIADYSQAIRLKTNYTDALYNRAWAYAKKTDYEKAIADYTQVIKLESSNESAYIERGRAWQAMGVNNRAESDFSEAQKIMAAK